MKTPRETLIDAITELEMENADLKQSIEDNDNEIFRLKEKLKNLKEE